MNFPRLPHLLAAAALLCAVPVQAALSPPELELAEARLRKMFADVSPECAPPDIPDSVDTEQELADLRRIERAYVECVQKPQKSLVYLDLDKIVAHVAPHGSDSEKAGLVKLAQAEQVATSRRLGRLIDAMRERSGQATARMMHMKNAKPGDGEVDPETEDEDGMPLVKAPAKPLAKAPPRQAQETPDPARMDRLQTCARRYRELHQAIDGLNSDISSVELAEAGLEARRGIMRSTKSWMETGAYNRSVQAFNQAAAEFQEQRRTVSARQKTVKSQAASFDNACGDLTTFPVERETLCAHPVNRSFCESRGW